MALSEDKKMENTMKNMETVVTLAKGRGFIVLVNTFGAFLHK